MQLAEVTVTDVMQEGERAMRLCNACRYCEGYCAVFPAMERRLTFSEQDLHYLANLCHNCGECYYACQYAPPHEFALNLPQTLAQIRTKTYETYARPKFLSALFGRGVLAGTVITAATIALFIGLMLVFVGPSVLFASHKLAQGSFYAVMPHTTMTAIFLAVSLLVVAALGASFLGFWRGARPAGGVTVRALAEAVWDALRLRYLDGGGEGCAYPTELPSYARRTYHHFTFYGYMLCFAATTVAAIYHYVFGWPAPYALLSAPVILGTLGGIGLLIGPAGLLWLRRSRNPELNDASQSALDVSFLLLLALTSLTGLLLLAFRETAAMGMLLAVHLAVVFALFVLIPYGKFVHGIYRVAALVRNSVEKQFFSN